MSDFGHLVGLLPVDKPEGPTSHDIVARARRDLRLRRIGHTGTLDPFASGLLLLLLGSATRLAEYFDSFPKEYRGVARLGIRTTTDDLEGEVLKSSDAWSTLKTATLDEAFASFTGASEQRPPSFSAKKVGGHAAHRLARAGHAVDLPPARITVHEISLEKVALPLVHFRVRCSTGTYVRSLARDLGERLEVGAHLVALRRLAIGPFRVQDALSAERLSDRVAVADHLVSPLAAVGHLPVVEIGEQDARRIIHGLAIAAPVFPLDPEGDVALAFEGRLLAVGMPAGDQIRPRKVFPIE